MTQTRWILLIALAIIAAVFLFVAPIPQDLNYHNFIDTRRIFGIPNFWDVMSNLPFLLVGTGGLIALSKDRLQLAAPELKPAYTIFFFGIALTAAGSGWYHLEPDNVSLVWDRLPMTIGFAGMLTIIVGDLVSVKTGRKLLWPMLIVGIGSVLYWIYTEQQGAGDLRPYALVQFLPMLLIAVILIQRRDAPNRTRVYWLMLGWYLLAKVFEFYDVAIFELGGILSGHTLKHLAAAVAPWILLRALLRQPPDREPA